MSGHTQFVSFLVVAGLICPFGSQAQDAQVLESQAATQPADPPPLTLVQMPSGPVVALYQNGQLTIEALNATLSDVLRAACNQTGAAIDLPPEADEQVFGTFGPGPPQEVIASLLNGSRFNYVMLGSVHDPNWLVRLTLTLKPPGPPDNRSVHLARQPVSKAAEAAIPQLSRQQAKQLSAEPSTADTQAPPRLPPRKHRRR